MSGRTLLAAALLLAAPAAAQEAPPKRSRLPVPEREKEKHGAVDTTAPTAEPEVVGLDTAAGAEPALVYHGGDPYTSADLPDAPLDTAAVARRPVPQPALERFRADPDYRYEQVGAAGPSLWARFGRWLRQTFLDPVAGSASPAFWRALWGVLAAAVLAVVLVRFVRGGGGGLFVRRGGAPEGALLLDAEDIAAVDLDALLRRAVEEARHRDAVRLLYLRALQALAGGGFVAWEKDKTNRDYLRELRRAASPLEAPFAELTRLFEWVWYGEAAVDAARFAAFRARFDRFSEALSAAGPGGAGPGAAGPGAAAGARGRP